MVWDEAEKFCHTDSGQCAKEMTEYQGTRLGERTFNRAEAKNCGCSLTWGLVGRINKRG